MHGAAVFIQVLRVQRVMSVQLSLVIKPHRIAGGATAFGPQRRSPFPRTPGIFSCDAIGLAFAARPLARVLAALRGAYLIL